MMHRATVLVVGLLAAIAVVLVSGQALQPHGPPHITHTFPVNTEANTNVVAPALSGPELQALAWQKVTCPFVGSAVVGGNLALRNSRNNPLASINDIVALGNSGQGSTLGNVLRIFATGNHLKMATLANPTALTMTVPLGFFSLDFPGSQGSHPGHSGILQGDHTKVNSGRFSALDLNRFLSHAVKDLLPLSACGKFIGENLVRDPASKVFQGNTAKLLLGDINTFVASGAHALLEKLKPSTPAVEAANHRHVLETLTKLLGEDNLVGSAGEFGLLFAFLWNSPKSGKINGELAINTADIISMFQHQQLPANWAAWKKSEVDWVTATTQLTIAAAKQYHQLKKGK